MHDVHVKVKYFSIQGSCLKWKGGIGLDDDAGLPYLCLAFEMLSYSCIMWYCVN